FGSEGHERFRIPLFRTHACGNLLLAHSELGAAAAERGGIFRRAGRWLLTAAFNERHGLVLTRSHAHVAAQRQRGKDVLRLAPAPAPERRTEADGEAWCVDSHCLRGEEVSELVNEDHESEDDYGCEPG